MRGVGLLLTATWTDGALLPPQVAICVISIRLLLINTTIGPSQSICTLSCEKIQNLRTVIVTADIHQGLHSSA